MMKITVVSYNNVAPAQALSAVFGQGSKTLGRGDDNYFVLPDPKNFVSRVQASIQGDGARHTIVNLSKATPILVNGKQINSDRECTLQVGDEIQIGLYLLRAESHLTAVGASMENIVGDGSVAVNAASNSADLNITPNPDLPVRNPIAQLNLALEADGGPELSAPVKVAKPKTIRVDPPEAAETDDRVENPVPDLKKLARAPEENSVCVEAPMTVENSALMHAFLNGAGIPAHTPLPVLTPEFMDMIGKLLAISIQGTVELSALRSLVKREVNADVTMVVVRNNNPIKFFRDSQTVLTQMLRKKMPGFLGPIEAMQDAYQDLCAHQLAVVAGMRAAMANTLGRLNPEHLARKLEAPTLLDALLPRGRKAGLWDRYVELFQQVGLETQDDFQTLFGEAFRKAYEQEVERLKDGVENAG